MDYTVLFTDKSTTQRYGVGVYAPSEAQAKAIGAVLLNRAYSLGVTAAALTVEVNSSLTSNVVTTT